MNNKLFKTIILIICCFLICGCSNIKANKELKKSKTEVVKYVKNDIKNKYGKLDVELVDVNDAYTVDNELIKNAKYYYFELKDKNGNIAYASYKDAFNIGEEKFDFSYIESYEAIHNNNELDYYKYLIDCYVDKNTVLSNYYAADYEDINLYSKARVVYKLNYKLSKMTEEQYFNFIKLGYDLRKYRVNKYGIINYDDPEVCFLFKGDKNYYCASYYGLVDEKNNYYKMKYKDTLDITDSYNLRSYINFSVEDDEFNKMIKDINSIGKYLIDNMSNVNVKYDNNYAYVLIENYTKNTYLLNILFKYKYDSNIDSFKYESMNIMDTNNINDFDGVIINTFNNY